MDLTSTQIQMIITAALKNHSQRLRRAAMDRTYGGPRFIEERAALRRNAQLCDGLAAAASCTDPARLTAALGVCEVIHLGNGPAVRTWRTEARNGYYAVDEFRDGRCVRTVVAVDKQNTADMIAGALADAYKQGGEDAATEARSK